MKIAIAADHAGFRLKERIIAIMETDGHEILDLGTNSESPVDYPDFAIKIAMAIISGEAERGILICGSGVGAAIAANKFRGIRAGLCHDTYSAHQGVEHDDMNLLCLGSRVIGSELALELIKTFLAAEFSGADRHKRRLQKLAVIEDENMKSPKRR
jgi:ribose 5-phosphate isomerase B